MQKVTCPHCGHQGSIETKVPKEVLVVLPCPACHDLVVIFRRKVIGIRREIIEHGTFEERKSHIAEVIAQFLDPDVLPEIMGDMERLRNRRDDDTDEDEAQDDTEYGESAEDESDGPHSRDELSNGANVPVSPISEKELERFIQFELKMIDDRSYFRRHFS